MPINLEKIDALIERYSKEEIEARNRINNLLFVKDKMLNGNEEDKKLIDLMGKITIESLEEIMKALKEATEKVF